MWRVTLAVVLVWVSAGLSAPARADSATPEPPVSAQRAQQFERLAATVSGRGIAPVIVGVRAAFSAQAALEGAEAELAQQARIAQAQAEVRRALSGTGAANLRAYRFIPYMAMQVDAAALEALRASPWVTSIAEDVPIPAALAESTALIGASTPTTGAWARGYTGAGWTVAVLDTGVESTHPFLSGKVVAEGCFSNQGASSPLPIGGGTSSTVCPNGLGNDTTSADAGRPCNTVLPDPGGNCDHGTHVAGIAAGKDPGGLGFSGVARDATIIAVQVFSRFDNYCGPNPCYLTWSSDQIFGLEYVYSLRNTYNIAAANMSIGGSLNYSSPCDNDPDVEDGRKAAIDLLRSVEIATVIAAGNNYATNGLSAPACISTAISVGSVGDTDQVSNFSNSADYLSLLAPGETIRSSTPNGTYRELDGTSMATPHVAGAWAVLKQMMPGASVDGLLQILQSTGVSVTDARPGANNRVKPRIQLEAALSALIPTSLAGGSAYNFGGTPIEYAVTRTVTLQNVMTATTPITPSLSGPGFVYVGAGNAFPGSGGTCGSSLAGGQSCSINLAFLPLSTGAFTGTLQLVTRNLINQPYTLTATLTGSAYPVCVTNSVVRDGGFELYTNPYWTQSDSVGGLALPRVQCGPSGCASTVGDYAPAGPMQGAGWGWFGGYTTTLTSTVTQMLTQTVTIPSGSATLQFFFNISRADPGTGLTDTFRALIADTPVFTATAAEAGQYSPAYQLVRLDAGAFATGSPVPLVFSATTTASGPIVNFNLDSVSLCAPTPLWTYLPIIGR
jgi:hypothetical protein